MQQYAGQFAQGAYLSGFAELGAAFQKIKFPLDKMQYIYYNMQYKEVGA
jgi:hypothetical protein